MAAPVEPSEHNGIEAVGLAAITGFSGDERRGDDVTVEAVVAQDAMEDETGTGGFVTGPNGALFGEVTEETPYFHEIAGEPEDLSLVTIPFEDRRRNRVGMDIESNPCILIHGWIPPLSASTLMCALPRRGLTRLSNPRLSEGPAVSM
jgi:hypothetical protein